MALDRFLMESRSDQPFVPQDQVFEQPSGRRPPQQQTLPTPSTHSSSLTVRGQASESLANQLPPSLTSASTLISAAGSDAARLAPLSYHINNEGIPFPFHDSPQQDRFECPFDFLGCNNTFPTGALCHSHSESHFQGHGPPEDCICPFCPEVFHNENRWQCWKERMAHLEYHQQLGQRMRSAGPDFALMRYLKDKHILSKEAYDEIVSHCRPIGTEVGIESDPPRCSAGRVEESRQEMRRRATAGRQTR